MNYIDKDKLIDERDRIKKLLKSNARPSTLITPGDLDELCSMYNLDVSDLEKYIDNIVRTLLEIKLERIILQVGS